MLNVSPVTTTSDDTTTDEPNAVAEPGGESDELLLGAGQSFWLGVVTVIAVAALALSLVAVIADNGGGEVASDGGDGGAAANAATIDGLDALAFEPNAVTLAAGDLEIEFVNAGNLQHNLVVLEAGTTIASDAEFEASMEVGRVDTLDGGQSGSVTLTLDAGTYQYVCLIPGHLQGGMEGTLTIQ